MIIINHITASMYTNLKETRCRQGLLNTGRICNQPTMCCIFLHIPGNIYVEIIVCTHIHPSLYGKILIENYRAFVGSFMLYTEIDFWHVKFYRKSVSLIKSALVFFCLLIKHLWNCCWCLLNIIKSQLELELEW